MVNTELIRVKEEDIMRIDALKILPSEPRYSVISRLLDKIEIINKRFLEVESNKEE